jgi:hypothetical protein
LGVTEEDCGKLVACQTPEGSIKYVTEEECRNENGACSEECVTQSCRAYFGKEGICQVHGLPDEASCNLYFFYEGASWYEDTCVLSWQIGEYDCLNVCQFLSIFYFNIRDINVYIFIH